MLFGEKSVWGKSFVETSFRGILGKSHSEKCRLGNCRGTFFLKASTFVMPCTIIFKKRKIGNIYIVSDI
jgi:hypothetical protein